MPNYWTREQLMKSKGIGPSHVAAILHVDPWTSAYQLWQQKTFRVPRPEQTAAMQYGKEREPEAVATFRQIMGIDPGIGEEQIIAAHPQIPFLRGIADYWYESEGILAQIKCPSSRSLIEELRETNRVPHNYMLQLAAEMSIFGVQEEFFLVWHSPDDHELVQVSMGDIYEDSTILSAFWESAAIPAIRDFWSRVENDTWFGGEAAQPDEEEWAKAVEERRFAKANVDECEALKEKADATLKRLMGSAKTAVAAGWEATWTAYKPSFGVEVKCADRKSMQKVMELLNPLKDTDGVTAVEEKYRPDNFSFRVEKVK